MGFLAVVPNICTNQISDFLIYTHTWRPTIAPLNQHKMCVSFFLVLLLHMLMKTNGCRFLLGFVLIKCWLNASLSSQPNLLVPILGLWLYGLIHSVVTSICSLSLSFHLRYLMWHSVAKFFFFCCFCTLLPDCFIVMNNWEVCHMWLRIFVVFVFIVLE